MSKTTALSPDVQAALDKQRAQIQGAIIQPRGFHISTQGKMFTLPDGNAHPGPLRSIVLDFVNYNTFYPEAYSRDKIVPPTCWALGREIAAMSPSENVPKPQHDGCARCPKNQFKSAATGRGKACRNTVRLALVPADANVNSDILALHVNPKALTGWGKYVRRLETEMGALPIQVITSIDFNKNEVFPTLTFGDPEPNPNLEVCLQLAARAQDILFREPELSSD